MLSSTVDFTGLKVQLAQIRAAAANTDVIVFKPASSNGYHLFGDNNGQITLNPGQAMLLTGYDALADVSSTAKALYMSSPDVDAQYDIILVAG